MRNWKKAKDLKNYTTKRRKQWKNQEQINRFRAQKQRTRQF